MQVTMLGEDVATSTGDKKEPEKKSWWETLYSDTLRYGPELVDAVTGGEGFFPMPDGSTTPDPTETQPAVNQAPMQTVRAAQTTFWDRNKNTIIIAGTGAAVLAVVLATRKRGRGRRRRR